MKKERWAFYFLVFVVSISFLLVGAFDFPSSFYEGLVGIGVASNAQIYIDSPLNITYNLTTVQDDNISLNVSSNFNLSSWRYSLKSLPEGDYIYTNIPFTPNITFNATAGSNELIVYANDTGGNVFNKSVVFFVSTPNHNPIIGNISSEIFVCEGDFLSSFFNVSDIDEDTLTIDISPKNPFYTAIYSSYSSVNSTFDIYEIFSGTLSKSNAGGVDVGYRIYPETITASDHNASDSKSTNITVLEINNAPSISNIGVKTIWTRGANSSFNYQVLVSDIEDGNQNLGNLTFRAIFSGVTLFNISSKGVINFTANVSYIGVHNISLCVNDTGISSPHQNISLCGQDGGSLTSCENFSLTVTNQNRVPEILLSSPANLSFNSRGYDILNFSILKYDPDGTIPDAYWYVDDFLKEYDFGGVLDTFYYTFGCEVSGMHTIRVDVTDGELNSSVQWNTTVSSFVCPSGVSAGGGGGGGGSKGRLYCEEKWACEEWQQCKNLRAGLELKDIGKEYELLMKDRCSLFNWDSNFCGYQTRTCNDLHFCNSSSKKPGIIRECYYTVTPNCEDGIKNCHDGKCEVLTDCGGPCKPCPTCSDGIKNQNEEDIDCGNPCALCVEHPKGLRWFIYIFLIAFIIGLILIIISYIKYYKNKRKLEEVSKKKGIRNK